MKRHGPEESFDDAPLFSKPRARSSDPWTSHAAAAQVPSFAERQHAQIMAVLEQHADGLTASEIAARVGVLDRVQVGRRMSELRDQHRVTESGETRKNQNNRHELVWKVNREGME